MGTIVVVLISTQKQSSLWMHSTPHACSTQVPATKQHFQSVGKCFPWTISCCVLNVWKDNKCPYLILQTLLKRLERISQRWGHGTIPEFWMGTTWANLFSNSLFLAVSEYRANKEKIHGSVVCLAQPEGKLFEEVWWCHPCSTVVWPYIATVNGVNKRRFKILV